MCPLLALAFCPEVINQSVMNLSVHLCSGCVVIVTKMVAELNQMTPPLVVKIFVRVLVGFGGGCVSISRLLAMIRVVQVSISVIKMA